MLLMRKKPVTGHIYGLFLLVSLQIFSTKIVFAGGEDCDTERGKKVFVKCQACHSITENGSHMAGPNLYGVINRDAGSVEGYTFSRSMRKSELVWNEDNLDKFFENPQKSVPRTKMAFAGLKSEKDRDAVICHLSQGDK